MHSPGINGEGELRVQLANPGSPGTNGVKTVRVCVCMRHYYILYNVVQNRDFC